MKRLMVALTAAVALATSQTAQAVSLNEGLNERIGQPLTAYALDHGAPQSSFDLGDGQRAFTWQFFSATPTNAGQCTVTLIATSKTGNATRLADWTVVWWRFSGLCGA